MACIDQQLGEYSRMIYGAQFYRIYLIVGVEEQKEI